MKEKIPQAVLRLLQRLDTAHFEAYPVGGSVRDLLRGVQPHDWDVATSARPEEVEELFPDCRVVETGVRHGTVTVIAGDYPVEITTFRAEGGYADGRHPDSVRFGVSLAEDLARRDFTIGALALDWKKDRVIDRFDGLQDLRRGKIRAVGDPQKRFSEDALRILRGLRFAAVLGFAIEEKTAAAMRHCQEGLSRVSAERIRVELEKLLCGKYVAAVLRQNADLVAGILPELRPMFGLVQQNPHHNRDVWEHTLMVVENVPPEPVLRWAALFHDAGKPKCFTVDEQGIGHFHGHPAVSADIAREVLLRLHAENQLIHAVTELIRIHDIRFPAEKTLVVRWSGRWGRERFLQFLALRRADTLAQADPSPAETYYSEMRRLLEQAEEENACFSLRQLALNGNAVKALGFGGAEIGAVLDTLLEEVQQGLLPNERAALLTRATELK